jgi:hypothetical protein
MKMEQWWNVIDMKKTQVLQKKKPVLCRLGHINCPWDSNGTFEVRGQWPAA